MKSTTHPPRVGSRDSLDRAAVHRSAGDAASIEADEERELEFFTDVDLSGRELTGLTLRECAFDGLDLDDANLRGARVIETVLSAVHAPVLRMSRSTLRDVVLERSRLGSAELFDTTWNAVRISSCKLGYVNLRGSTLTDVIFEDCTIDELDLGGVTATRVAFPGSSVTTLDVTRATLKHVDLRGLDFRAVHGLEGLAGATVNEFQVAELAPLFAAQLGIVVEG
ncbi:MAG: pentapeptide repeat-containing protein [Mycetocola sp.]